MIEAPAQRAIEQAQRGRPPLRATAELRVEGPLDRATFDRAVAALRAGHPLLDGLGSGAVALASDGELHRIRIAVPARCADATGVALVADDLAAHLTGAAPPPRPDYAAVAATLARLDADPRADPARAFWRERDRRTPAPPLTGAPALAGAGLDAVAVPIDGALAAAVLAHATPVALALTAWHAALVHATGTDAVPVWLGLQGRRHAALRAVAGPLARLVPGLVTPSRHQPLAAALAEVTAALAEAERWHDHAPVDLAAEAAGGYGFTWVTLPAPRTGAGRRCTVTTATAALAPLAVALTLGERAGELRAVIEHDRACVDAAGAAAIGRDLVGLLASACAEPGRALGRLPRVAPAERAAILAAGRGPDQRPLPVLERIAAQIAAGPDRIAVRAERDLTYAELDRRADALAAALIARGAGPGAPVAVAVERSSATVVAALAALRAGAAFAPLDLAHPPARLAGMLATLGAAVVIHDHTTAAQLPDGPTPRLAIAAVAEGGAAPAVARPRLDDGAYVIFTSGSTGSPKASLNTHRGLANLLAWMADRLGVGPDDRILHKAPPGFDVGVWELFLPLVTGACVVVAPPGVHRDPLALAAVLAGRAVTIAHFVPSLLRSFLDGEAGEPRPCPALRALLCGGEALTPALRAQAQARFSAAEVLHLYGPSETAIDVTAWPRPGAAAAVAAEAARLPIGWPIAGVDVHVLDDALAPLPVGAIGEVCVGGAALARGYLGQPGLTADRFVPDPAGSPPGSRLYRTGDRGRRLADGAIELIGRADHQIKLGGVRLELGEIEAHLGACPGVDAAVVVADGARLVAYLAGPRIPPAAALREHLRARLPELAVPSQFVELARLPLGPNGKVARDRLPAAPAAEPAAAALPTLAELVRAAWVAVLGHADFTDDDNLFEQGAHSLHALQIAARLRSGLDRALPLAAVFEDPTVRGLAARIARGARADGEARPPRPELRPQPRDRPLPLSPPQRQLWFLDRLAPGSSAYHVVLALAGEGALDLAALRASLDQVAARHEALRTRIVERDGTPWQEIDPPGPVGFAIEELADDSDATLDAALAAERARGFDLARDRPWRARLLRRGPSRWALALTLHHLVTDDWSNRILIGELLALYPALAAGRTPALPPLPVQYADVAIWLEQLAEHTGAERAGWRRRLAGLGAGAELPFARGPDDGHADRSEATLPPALVAALRGFCRAEATTRFCAIGAAYAILLHRLTAAGDLVVGTPVANRGERALEPLIGLLADLWPLRLELSDRPSFRTVAARVRAAVVEAHAHADVPFDRIADDARAARGAGPMPLVRFALTVAELDPPPLAVPGLRLRPHEVGAAAAKFDLLLAVAPAGDERLVLEHRRAAVDASTGARLLAACVAVLADGLARPDAPIATLALGPAEDARSHGLRADAHAPVAADLAARLAAQVARAPTAAAVIDGAAVLDYGTLWRQAGGVATRLRAAGAGPERPVAIVARGAALPVALVAAARAGAPAVPIDPDAPAARRRWIAAHAGVRALVTGGGTLALADDRGPGVAHVDVDRAPLAAADAELAPPVPLAPDALACIYYTSGSTGEPKGVLVTWAAIASLFVELGELALGPATRMALASNPGFDALTFEVWGALLHGGALVVIDPATRLSPAALTAQLRADRVDVMFVPTALLHRVARTAPATFAPLATLVFGGERVAPAAIRAIRAAGAPARILHAYGPTETTTFACWHPVDADEAARPALAIGRPLGGRSLQVVDELGRPVPIGLPGELCVGGAAVARGYLGRPGPTADRFVPDPDGPPGARRYRTGDLVRWRPDGALEFLGRRDQQVKLRGFRVELGEVEAALLRQPGVAQAVAVVHPGDDEPVLIAYLVAGPGGVPAALGARLAAELPAVMVPAHLIALDELPLSANGKVDRAALAARPPPARAADRSTRPPRDPLEALVAAEWGAVLGYPEVGADDDFFASGGHSLLAMTLLARVRSRFGVELSVRALFDAATPAGLAAAVRRARPGGAADPVPRPPPRDHHALAPAQEALWRIQGARPDAPFFHIGTAFRLRGPLDLDALAGALGDVVARHEALRTRIVDGGDRPHARVVEPAPFALPVVAVDGEAAAERWLRSAPARPFDLVRAPPVRATALALGDRDHVLALELHHLVADGESLELVVREVLAAYADRRAGRAVAAPPPPLQQGDVIAWQRARWTPEQLTAVLAGRRPRPLAPPWPEPVRTGRASFWMRRLTVEVDAATTARVRAGAGAARATLFLAALAAAFSALRAATGVDHLRIATNVAGRGRLGLDGVVGLLVNTVLVEADLAGAGDPDEVLARVRAAALAAYELDELPFELLIDALRADGALDPAALYQVMVLHDREPVTAAEVAGLTITGCEPPWLDDERREVPTAAELILGVREHATTLTLIATYRTRRFTPADAAALLERWRAALAAPAAHLPGSVDGPATAEVSTSCLPRELP